MNWPIDNSGTIALIAAGIVAVILLWTFMKENKARKALIQAKKKKGKTI